MNNLQSSVWHFLWPTDCLGYLSFSITEADCGALRRWWLGCSHVSVLIQIRAYLHCPQKASFTLSGESYFHPLTNTPPSLSFRPLTGSWSVVMQATFFTCSSFQHQKQFSLGKNGEFPTETPVSVSPKYNRHICLWPAQTASSYYFVTGLVEWAEALKMSNGSKRRKAWLMEIRLLSRENLLTQDTTTFL